MPFPVLLGSQVRRRGRSGYWSRLSTHLAIALMLGVAGCGTTRMSDTFRTGTEQLLLSTAIDRSINEMDFSTLTGKDVYFDPQYMRGVIDEGYIISSIRQKLLASGVYLKVNREEARYIVEARAGAVGTNRHDVLLGIPQVNVPGIAGVTGTASVIPEIPFAKSTQQKGVAKLAVFAYNQQTGQPVWQSGTFPISADSRDTWVLGTGPFQRGTIYDGTNFAGSRMLLPFAKDKPQPPKPSPEIPITAEVVFTERTRSVIPVPPQLATKPKPSGLTPPSQFQPGVSPSAPTPPKPPAPVPSSVPATSNATQSQTTSGFSTNTFPGMNGTGTNPAGGAGNASGGNAAAGLIFLGKDAIPGGR